MVALALAALLAVAPMQDVPQTAPSAAAAEPVDLGEVEVTGRTLDDMIRSFVTEVAEPNRRRGIARWADRLCVGVVNLRAEPAQYIVDRVSTVAEDLGLRTGAPGCAPNVVVIASAEADNLAGQLVRERRRGLRMGGAGMDRGGAALRDFAASDQPVRWWQVSIPVDADTGARAIRLPGECKGSCDAMGNNPGDYAPTTSIFAASRLSNEIVDELLRTVVILDMEQVGGVSAQQLADYVAMITLAQIDPEADTSGYATILNLFQSPDAAGGLTDWDRAYLSGLYDAERTRRNLRAGRMEIADSIHRSHQALREAEAE
ncbi:MAG: hypothetical protein IR159_06845 [Brevundimonas sp.]|nr:hypothetical protein [Brevundimonas sp.]